MRIFARNRYFSSRFCGSSFDRFANLKKWVSVKSLKFWCFFFKYKNFSAEIRTTMELFFFIFLTLPLVSPYKTVYRELENENGPMYSWESNRIEAAEADENNEIDMEKSLLGGKDRTLYETFNIPMIGHQEQLNDIPLGTPDEEKNVPGEPLTPEDFINARKIEHLAPVMDENSPDPIQSAGLFEGDIAGVNASGLMSSNGRNAIKDFNKMWPGGVIPYVISSAFNSYERSVIAAAFEDYQTKTCIRFVPRTRQINYVYLVKGSGCSSLVGRNGDKQQISLGPGCVYKGVIIHELMHAVGFWHEQSRTDRDNYVTILWHNIMPGMEFNFNKYNWDTIQTLGVSYDTSSVMHYTQMSFSKDGRSPTIVPKQPGVDFIGQRTGFSQKDLMKINRLYKCNDQTGVKPPVVKPPVPEDHCQNNHQFCDYWSRIGECQKNPNWMLVNCKKSCNQCAKKCNDYNKDCEYWARIGECTKNPSYMTIYCARSCNTCHMSQKDTTKCLDHNKYCASWAEDNQCVINPNYMLQYCRLSCKQC